MFSSRKCKLIYEIRPTYPSPTSPLLLDVFSKLLEKDPHKRITMGELRVHPWVTNEGIDPLPSTEVNCSELVTEVTEEDMENAIKPIANIFVVVSSIRSFHSTRCFGREGCFNTPTGSLL